MSSIIENIKDILSDPVYRWIFIALVVLVAFIITCAVYLYIYGSPEDAIGFLVTVVISIVIGFILGKLKS